MMEHLHLQSFHYKCKEQPAPDNILVLHLHIPCNNHGLVYIMDSWSGNDLCWALQPGTEAAQGSNLLDKLRKIHQIA